MRIFFYLWLISFSIADEEYAKTADDLKCDPQLPHFSVGDVNLTKENYEAFKVDHKVFILGLSDSECSKCCYMESMLKRLHSLLFSNYTFKGKPIPIARLDIKIVRGSFAEDLPPLNFFPQILMYKYGKYYIYTYYLHYPSIMNFINRVLYPTIQLNTTKEIDEFLDISKEYPEFTGFYGYGEKYIKIGREMMPKRLTRVIAFISSKEDYRTEIREITRAAQGSSQRDDLRVAFVYNKDIIKDIKDKHRNWFPEFSSTSLIIQRVPGDISMFDISTEGTNYFTWLTEYHID